MRNSEVSEFVRENLAQYLLSEEKYPRIKNDDSKHQCLECGKTDDLIELPKGIKCGSCAVFGVPFQMFTKDNAINMRQKDTLLLISPNKTTVVGDIKPDEISPNGNLTIVPMIPGEVGWRKMLVNYILNDHEKIAPALIISQGKANKNDDFVISYSPDFVTICGQYDARINVKNLKAAYFLVEKIKKLDWKSFCFLIEESRFNELSKAKQKKLAKLKESYPSLVEFQSVLPLPNSKEFELLSWACND